ncbi:unnamed protein product [Fraxinus pennsylvanica]|uniref:Uncharacterized protein n=1 Tax=Fraxinus pennsylvanica TaxID=56036 RepID=A0AAD2AC62_9LAMI|nr:unnamed protein product [Fraxinus pennsylvanica]
MFLVLVVILMLDWAAIVVDKVVMEVGVMVAIRMNPSLSWDGFGQTGAFINGWTSGVAAVLQFPLRFLWRNWLVLDLAFLAIWHHVLISASMSFKIKMSTSLIEKHSSRMEWSLIHVFHLGTLIIITCVLQCSHVNIILINAQTKFQHSVNPLPKVFVSSRLNPEESRTVSNSNITKSSTDSSFLSTTKGAEEGGGGLLVVGLGRIGKGIK